MSGKANRPTSVFREFLDSEASGGIVLMGAAALALIVANSPLGPAYFSALKTYAGPLSIGHWINDGLMAVFFLLVGLEIKREMLDGQLSTWPRRALPGICLSSDSGILTAAGNDYGFDEIFARQIAALGQPGDVLICLTTSGKSKKSFQTSSSTLACRNRCRMITGR